MPKKVRKCIGLARQVPLAPSTRLPAAGSATMSIHTREASKVNALRTVNAKHKHMEMLLLDRLKVRDAFHHTGPRHTHHHQLAKAMEKTRKLQMQCTPPTTPQPCVRASPLSLSPIHHRACA